MNEKSRGRATSSGNSLVAQFSQLAGTQQLGAEMMASLAMTKGLGESFSTAQRAGIEMVASAVRAAGLEVDLASTQRLAVELSGVAGTQYRGFELAMSFAKSQGLGEGFSTAQRAGIEMVASAVRAAGLGESFARTQQLGIELATSIARTQSVPVTAGFAGLQGLLAETAGTRVLVQRLAAEVAQMTPPVDTSWIMTMIPAAGRVSDLLPATLRGRDMTDVLRPLLQTGKYRQFGGAAADLAKWAEGRLVGAETASPERFADIAEQIDDVELDEYTEQRFELIAENEPALTAVTEYWELSDLSLENPKNRRALAVLLGWSFFLLATFGFLGAPVLTAAIMTAGGAAWTVKNEAQKALDKKYSPAAQAQLDAMGRRGLGNRRSDREGT